MEDCFIIIKCKMCGIQYLIRNEEIDCPGFSVCGSCTEYKNYIKNIGRECLIG